MKIMMALLLLSASAFGQVAGQDAKEKAIEQMRPLANIIKHCPQTVHDMSPPHIQCFSAYSEAGPPLNVTWDVEESKTARAPYQGYVEFDLPCS